MDVVMRLPDLATNDSAIKVIRWLVDVGQDVRRGQPLVEVETDKAVMEVESVVTGTLRSHAVPPGGEATTGQVIAIFDAAEGPVAAAASPIAVVAESEPVARPQPAVVGASERISFFARNRLARASRQASTAAAGSLSVARRTLARRMRESKQTIPHFYLQTSANAEPMSRCREARAGRNIAWDAFFVYAIGRALRRFEMMRYRYEDDRLVPQDVDAVGVAVDLDGDLFTVAIDRPADKPPEQISDEIRAAVERLRGGDPKARLGQRACMTVSNLGRENVESFTAVINPPESAILAVGKVMPAVVAIDGRVAIQTRVTLTLSVDHRVVNGRYAGAFLGAIVDDLEAL